mgnify:CR=1 FL=1
MLFRSPEVLRGAHALEQLVVLDNDIRVVPEWLAELPLLNRLWLGENRRCAIPTVVERSLAARAEAIRAAWFKPARPPPQP